MSEDSPIRFQLEAPKIIFEALFDKAIAAVPSRDILPVLNNFQLQAKDNQLRVISTDLELSVLVTTEAVTIVVPGTIVLPAKKIMEILTQTVDGPMSIVVRDQVATVTHSGATWSLRLPKGDDFPDLADLTNSVLHTIDKARFINALLGVRYAAATDTSRPSLMMIDITDGKTTACNGMRIQQVSIGTDFPMDLRIPIGVVDDLIKLLSLNELEQIRIGESSNQIIFEVGADVFLLNKLTSAFAPVEDLILRPAMTNTEKLSVNREALLHAVKRVRITADQDIAAIALDLAENEITVSSSDALGNGSWEGVPAVWSDKPRQVILNHQYLTDMLTMYEGDSCSFYLGTDTNTRKSPLLLKDTDTQTLGVINQMRRNL